jgi:hypothetical protein
MGRNDKILTYFISITLILLFISVFILFIIVGRVVLDENSGFESHLINTKTLLQDVSEVKERGENISSFNDLSNSLKDLNEVNLSKKFIIDTDLVFEFSNINVNKNKTFLTLNIKGEVHTFNGYVYIKESNPSYNLDDYVLLDIKSDIKPVKIININKNDNLITFSSLEAIKTYQGNSSSIIGKILTRNN